MKPRILIQLDTDPQPSVFDAVVAIDAGANQLLRHGGVTPETVAGLVHGAMFTRGPDDLKSTALFVGGSDVAAAEAVLAAIQKTFFGPFRVSTLFDPNGANTTAAAAVLAAIAGATATVGSLHGQTVAVLGATGPVGRRVARLLLRSGARVAVGSRSLDRAQSLAEELQRQGLGAATAFATATSEQLRSALNDVPIVVAAGAAGVVLLPETIRRSLPALRVAIDLNAVPPLGIDLVKSADAGNERDGIVCWGALGVGGTKMKIHKQAIRSLFEANDRWIDAEQCLEIGQALGG